MNRLAAALLFCLPLLARSESGTAKLTFFRERVDTSMRHEKFKLFVDGQEVAKLGIDRFLTIDVTPGKHDIRTKRWGGYTVVSAGAASWASEIVVDLKPGERVYVHPRFFECFRCILVKENLETMSCSDSLAAIARGDHAPMLPVNVDKIHWDAITTESAFPAECQ